MTDVDAFEAHRGSLLALAYRMLGDLGRAEDMVQEAWIRWQSSAAAVESSKAYLVTIVARLCLDELGSARARHEESRSDRLPEPVDLETSGISRVEVLDRVSMAFVVLLQRLTPAERAVLLLHDVFDMKHGAIADLLGKNAAASRQLLHSARTHVEAGRRTLESEPQEHRRLLHAFIAAIASGDESTIRDLLAQDATMTIDPGATPQSYGNLRKVGRPVLGQRRVAALVASFARQAPSSRLSYREHVLNGQPALVAVLAGQVMSVMCIAVAAGKIQHLYLQNDPERLQRVPREN